MGLIKWLLFGRCQMMSMPGKGSIPYRYKNMGARCKELVEKGLSREDYILGVQSAEIEHGIQLDPGQWVTALGWHESALQKKIPAKFKEQIKLRHKRRLQIGALVIRRSAR